MALGKSTLTQPSFYPSSKLFATIIPDFKHNVFDFIASSYQSRKFKVYEGWSNISEPRQLLYNNTEHDGFKFLFYFQSPVLLQHIEIFSPEILTLCEFKLIRAGEYGVVL